MDNDVEYRLNGTTCGNGTFGPYPDNQTCCSDSKSVKEITFRNTALMPTAKIVSSANYNEADYSIPTSIVGFLTSTPILETISISLCILVSSTSVAVQAEAPAVRISKTLSPAIESGIAVAEDLISLVTGVLLYRIGQWQDKRLTEAEQKAALQAVVNKAPEMMGDDFHTEVDATAGSE